jgi:hypothetical protein
LGEQTQNLLKCGESRDQITPSIGNIPRNLVEEIMTSEVENLGIDAWTLNCRYALYDLFQITFISLFRLPIGACSPTAVS